jgi:hypothetical protein
MFISFDRFKIKITISAAIEMVMNNITTILLKPTIFFY